MSSKLQIVDDHRVLRNELYLCSERSLPWADPLQMALAPYPFHYEPFLAELDTIDAQQPVERGFSPYTGILLAAPGPEDGDSLGVAGEGDEQVLIHQVIGLFPAELEHAAEKGADDLWEELLMGGQPLIDRVRRSLR